MNVKILSTRYLGVSSMGNPAYDVVLTTQETGEVIHTRTMANTMMSYGIENSEYKEEWHTAEFTKAGRLRALYKINA